MEVIENYERQVVTKLVNNYRECVRSIWNSYFLQPFSYTQDFELVDSFKRVREELFRSIVLCPVVEDIPDDFLLGLPSPLVKIVPTSVSGDMPVMINRTRGETHGYWDHPISTLKAGADLLFVDFFDWNPYGFLDMSLVIAEISDCPEHPDIVGHRLIADLRYAGIAISDK